MAIKVHGKSRQPNQSKTTHPQVTAIQRITWKALVNQWQSKVNQDKEARID